jgi:hypothetical protein
MHCSPSHTNLLPATPFRAAFFCSLLTILALAGCASSPRPAERPASSEPKRDIGNEPPRPAPSGSSTAPRKSSNEGAQQVAQELEQILQTELSAWRKDYAKRQRLSSSCPSGLYYSYGMRLIQPSSFRGDYADLVKQRYGSGTEFLVIATAEKAAAARAGILPGDRLMRVNTINANELDSAKRVASESRRWRQPYPITLERDGKIISKMLTPDKLCDVKL